MMNLLRRLFKLVLFIVIVYGAARFGVVFFTSQLNGERDPYLQNLTQNSVTVRWQTEQNRLGVLKYGTDPDQLNQTRFVDVAGKVQSITLTELEPDTRYYYVVGDISGYRELNTDIDWFRTMPAYDADKPVRIWAIGDSGQPGPVAEGVRDGMLRWIEKNPRKGQEYLNMFVSLGDMAYRSGTNEQFQAGFFDIYHDIVRNQSIWPVLGNHDSRRWTYFRLFDLPENGEAGGVPSGTENYYSVDYSNVHMVMLDSQDSSMSPGSEMLQWLKKDLKQNTRPWVIVALHHPPYTKGSHNSDDKGDSNGRMIKLRENVLPILEAGGVDLVLAGHSHMYERSFLIDCHYDYSKTFNHDRVISYGTQIQHKNYKKPLNNAPNAGTVYVVAGSSSKVDMGPLDHPAMVVSRREAGSLLIDVDGNTLTTRFINPDSEVVDEFSIVKVKDYTSDYAGCDWSPPVEPVAAEVQSEAKQ